MKITIERENNQYNKYMKWHYIATLESGGQRSEWFKTEKEAQRLRDRTMNGDSVKFTMQRPL